MRVYYDTEALNIVVDDIGRYFPSGSLIAENVAGKVNIKNKNTNVNELYTEFDNIVKVDDTPAGANINETLEYLNNEFAKGMITGQDSFTGGAATITVSNARILSGDRIMVFPQGAVLNEVIFVSSVSDGSFVVSRTIVNALGVLTSGLIFNWIRL